MISVITKTVFDFIKKAVSLLVSVVMLFPSVISQSKSQAESDRTAQIERIAALEQDYKNGKIAPVDENSFVLGDWDSALKNGVKFNELEFIATHNSYQTQSVEALREIYGNLSELTFGLVSDKTGGLDSKTLTEQLNSGIRSIELDIETVVKNGEVSFRCMHSPGFDMTTNCYDLSLALKEIYLWSENNPNHIPITIIIEPKKVFVPIDSMRFFNLKYVNLLDSLLRESFGDKLFTPADMLRDYDSFADMRAADDWCKVSDMLGSVLVLLHDTTVTEKYIKQDETIKSQAMFPMLRYDDKDESYASFLLINKPQDAVEHSQEIIGDYKLIVRTQVDTYTSVSREKSEQALLSGSQILSTDYPQCNAGEGGYYLSFENDKTVRVR